MNENIIKEKDDDLNMFLAIVQSSRSSCVSHQVGCVISRDRRIISSGYNGTVSGVPNCNEVNKYDSPTHSEWSRKNEIHAEMNAILAAAKSGISLDGCTLYTTLSPCPDCCKNIAATGIKRIVYLEDYNKSESDWVIKCKSYGVSVTKIPKENVTKIHERVLSCILD